MVLANMTFEIWRKARSKGRGRKEAELNMGEKVLKRSERNGPGKKGKVLPPVRISLARDSLSTFPTLLLNGIMILFARFFEDIKKHFRYIYKDQFLKS